MIAVFDIGGPLLAYNLLRSNGFSTVAALVLSGLFPAVGMIIGVIGRRRQMDDGAGIRAGSADDFGIREIADDAIRKAGRWGAVEAPHRPAVPWRRRSCPSTSRPIGTSGYSSSRSAARFTRCRGS